MPKAVFRRSIGQSQPKSRIEISGSFPRPRRR
jgi:hypothetical protein